MADKIRIVIADDHPIFRDGLKQLLNSDENMEVIAEAENGSKALRLILEKNPDIAVLDMSMPEKTGMQVARELKEIRNETKIVFLTMFTEEDIFDEAMDIGVQGYVLKENAENDILDCVRRVADGDYYISSHISGLLVKRKNKADELNRKVPSLDNLTPTERKILKLIAHNKTSREISDELFISYRTIENHRTNISNKLNIHGTHSLVKFAIENKNII